MQAGQSCKLETVCHFLTYDLPFKELVSRLSNLSLRFPTQRKPSISVDRKYSNNPVKVLKYNHTNFKEMLNFIYVSNYTDLNSKCLSLCLNVSISEA